MAHSKLLRFFPVPQYIVMPSFGLEISERTVKYLEVKDSYLGLTVGNYGLERIPEGAVVKGVVVDPSKLVPVLANIKKTKGVNAVRLSIPEEQVYTFQIDIEYIPGMELRDAILLNLEGYIPVSASEVEFDYDIISQIGNKIKIQVAAAERNAIESYINACNMAGIEVLSCEYECQALARAITKPKEKSVIYIIDIGRASTTLSVVQDGVVVSSNTIARGGEEATTAVSEKFGIDRIDAEILKHKIGMNGKDEYKELPEILKASYAPLFEEIISQYNAWLSYIREKSNIYRPIESVQIFGTEALTPGIIDLFQATFHKPVYMANVWTRIEAVSTFVPKIHFNDSLVYGTAIGLAIGAFEV